MTQKSGATGAQTTEQSCTGARQEFTLDVHDISDVPFSPGKITTDLHGGSYCFIDGCSDQDLADHLKQKFRV